MLYSESAVDGDLLPGELRAPCADLRLDSAAALCPLLMRASRSRLRVLSSSLPDGYRIEIIDKSGK